MREKAKGFTLLEMLTVLVVVAILSSLVVGGIHAHIRAVKIAKTRLQFLQYESAINRYVREYGGLPSFFKEEEVISLAHEGNSKIFVKILSGAKPSGNPLSQKEVMELNPKRKRFHHFSDNEFLKNSDHTINRDFLVDAFNNKNIFIIVEDPFDEDTIISKEKFPEEVQSRIKGKGVENPVVIFSVSEDGKEVISNCFD